MTKIYQFPQGKERRQFEKAVKRIKQAPRREARNQKMKVFGGKLFYVLRYSLALSVELICVIALTVLHTLRYLVFPLLVFAMLIFWHNNGGVWDKAMLICLGLLIGSFISHDSFMEAKPIQFLLGVRTTNQVQKENEN